MTTSASHDQISSDIEEKVDGAQKINDSSNQLSTDIEDLSEKKRKEDALHTLFWLRTIQLGLCLVMLGGYARITATTLNAFSPKHLDKAFEDDHLDIAIPLILVTGLFVAIDFLYFWALTARDLFDFKQKQKEYEDAKKESLEKSQQQENELTAAKSEEILGKVTTAHQAALNERKDKIIKVLKNDIFIRQLLIQCDIHQKDLLAAYQHADNQKDIITLLKEYSEGVSLKDYQFLHKEHQDRSRDIEYVQALKVPLRFTSILLLLEGRAFTCPDMIGWLGENDTMPGYYQFIISGSIILWAITYYAYKLEFRKNDTDSAYDKDIRSIRSAHHNALLSTTILALERKTRGEPTAEPAITPAPEDIDRNLFWGKRFTDIVSWKWVLSACLLGPLGRRPFTIFALSGEKNTFDTQMIVGFAVLLLLAADLYYVNLSIKEETWELKNQEDKKFVLKACERAEQDSTNSDELDEFATDDEKALHAQLQRGEKAVIPHAYKDEHKFLAGFKEFIDKSIYLKFGMRAISLVFSIQQFLGVERSLKEANMGVMAGNEALMLFAGLLGMALGYLLQQVNIERDRRLRPSKEDKENYLTYTEKTSLYFREPVIGKPSDLSETMIEKTRLKSNMTIDIQGESWRTRSANSPSRLASSTNKQDSF